MTNCALQFWLLALAGWINREQQDVIAYLREEIGGNQQHVWPHHHPVLTLSRVTLLLPQRRADFEIVIYREAG